MCGAGKFKTQAMSTSYKVPCRPWTTCTNGEYVQAKGTTASDAVCASHSAPCKADQYESKKPTVNSDRQCKGAGSCKNGMLITPAQRTQADHCGICNVGFRLNNKACLKNTCKCSNGKFPTVCPKDGATACVSCNPGYILDKTKTCLEKKCSCANGIPLTGTKCPSMGLWDVLLATAVSCSAKMGFVEATLAAHTRLLSITKRQPRKTMAHAALAS